MSDSIWRLTVQAIEFVSKSHDGVADLQAKVAHHRNSLLVKFFADIAQQRSLHPLSSSFPLNPGNPVAAGALREVAQEFQQQRRYGV